MVVMMEVMGLEAMVLRKRAAQIELSVLASCVFMSRCNAADAVNRPLAILASTVAVEETDSALTNPAFQFL